MQAEIRSVEKKKLIGKRLSMSFGNNETTELWRSFMPHRNEIKNRTGTNLISMQVYDKSFDFTSFNPQVSFDKWAAVEVNSFDEVPADMETFIIPEGLYAVFIHIGDAATAAKTFSYIFGEWLPGSIYEIDNRPHFEILGDKYKHGSEDSEEEVLVPIKLKLK